MSRSKKSIKQEHEGTQPVLPKPTVEELVKAVESGEHNAEKYGYGVIQVWDARLPGLRPLTANEFAKVARFRRREAERHNKPWLIIARAV